jgi:hypothetical protein
MQDIGSSIFPTRLDMQWPGVVDNANGVGLFGYQLYVGGGLVAIFQAPEFSDPTVQPETTYCYNFNGVDYHGNAAMSAGTCLTTPPAGSIDPRRVGVRSTGSYWGAAGEQIDTLSGNLNFTIPLLQAQGRNGWAVPFALSYNSQFWRQDSGGTWKMARDVGYGLGWRLQAGSLTPYYRVNWTLDHYLFIDATGAEYRLSINTNGVWTSNESIYVSYDSNTNRLYFPDGSFWVMGATSGGTEQDAGTKYPTVMQDTNGNQILIRYNTGLGAIGTNSSARINEIEDVRAVYNSSTLTYQTYVFTYNNDPIPHLTSLSKRIPAMVQFFGLTYLSNQPLNSPFSPATSFGTTTLLQTVTGLYGFGHSLQYDSGGSGELTQVTVPMGGKLRWTYRPFTYVGSRTQREVQNRYLTSTVGGVESPAYVFTRNDAADASLSLHSGVTLDDPSGIGQKAWTFATSGAAWQLGLATRFEERPSAAQASQPIQRKDFTWVQDSAANPYIGTVLTTLEPAGANLQTKTTQTLDTHGNVLSTNIYDYGNLTTPARTYTNTYLNNSNYTSRYIFNRLSTTALTDGTQTVTLVTNTYDSLSLTDLSGVREHDPTYGTSFVYRGNVSVSTPVGGPATNIYRDIGGNVTTANDSFGHSVSVTTGSAVNYAAPSVITPNSNANLQTSNTYTGWLELASVTKPNNATASATYDWASRPTQTVSIYGALRDHHKITFTFVRRDRAAIWCSSTPGLCDGAGD